MVVDLTKETQESAQLPIRRGGGTLLSAYCIRGAELSEPELLLTLRWLALPLEQREAALNHVEGRSDDHGERRIVPGRD